MVQVSAWTDLRSACLGPPDEKAAFVWNPWAFAQACRQEIKPIDQPAIAAVHQLYGCPIQVDRDLPDGVVEFRSSLDGRRLARIVNVGQQINEMG